MALWGLGILWSLGLIFGTLYTWVSRLNEGYGTRRLLGFLDGWMIPKCMVWQHQRSISIGIGIGTAHTSALSIAAHIFNNRLLCLEASQL